MKRSSLLRHLRRHGCHLKREGTSHSLWMNPNPDVRRDGNGWRVSGRSGWNGWPRVAEGRAPTGIWPSSRSCSTVRTNNSVGSWKPPEPTQSEISTSCATSRGWIRSGARLNSRRGSRLKRRTWRPRGVSLRLSARGLRPPFWAAPAASNSVPQPIASAVGSVRTGCARPAPTATKAALAEVLGLVARLPLDVAADARCLLAGR